MGDRLVSNYQITAALGTAYLDLRAEDARWIAQERGKASRIVDRMRLKNGRCAACGAEDRGLAGAHLLPVAEGGKSTDDNLVLLCHHCHGLYDHGYASQAEMAAAKDGWRKGVPVRLRDEMESRRAEASSEEDDVRSRIGLGNWIVALRMLGALRKAAKADGDGITVSEAEVERRRGAIGGLKRARRLLQELCLEDVAAELLPRYYYERGYVAQLWGEPREACGYFRNSWEAAESLGSPWQELIGRAQEIAATLIGASDEGVFQGLEKAVCSLAAIAKQVREMQEAGHYASRWDLNCVIWRFNWFLRAGQFDAADRELEVARPIRQTQHSRTGWTRLAGAAMAGKKGMLILFSGAKPTETEREGLPLLRRAIVTLLRGGCRHPEGIRDYLFAYKAGMAALGRRDTGNLDEVRCRIRDGSSFLDPYRFGEVGPVFAS